MLNFQLSLRLQIEITRRRFSCLLVPRPVLSQSSSWYFHAQVPQPSERDPSKRRTCNQKIKPNIYLAWNALRSSGRLEQIKLDLHSLANSWRVRCNIFCFWCFPGRISVENKILCLVGSSHLLYLLIYCLRNACERLPQKRCTKETYQLSGHTHEKKYYISPDLMPFFSGPQESNCSKKVPDGASKTNHKITAYDKDSRFFTQSIFQ